MHNSQLDLLIMFCLLLVGWRYTSDRICMMDLSLYDESSYLIAGATRAAFLRHTTENAMQIPAKFVGLRFRA